MGAKDKELQCCSPLPNCRRGLNWSTSLSQKPMKINVIDKTRAVVDGLSSRNRSLFRKGKSVGKLLVLERTVGVKHRLLQTGKVQC